MHEVGIARAGLLRIPAAPELAYEFLQVRWRTIQHYGVEVDGLRYNGDALNGHRNEKSPYGGIHAGKWPVRVNPDDVRHAWFQEPPTTPGIGWTGSTPPGWARRSAPRPPCTPAGSPPARAAGPTRPGPWTSCWPGGNRATSPAAASAGVGLTSNTTLRTLNRMICEFYGHPGTGRANAAQLASYALDCVLSCETRIGIIDDVHFIDPRRKDGLDVSNHLKWLANELPVTFIYAGVGLAERRFFAEGLPGESAVLAQTARRWIRLRMPAFDITADDGRRQWRSLLKATERQLVLSRAAPGMLVGLADYLFERTTGHIGSLMTLITRGCLRAVRSGGERLTAALLDGIRIDEASEQARPGLAAAFAAGRPTAAPGRREPARSEAS